MSAPVLRSSACLYSRNTARAAVSAHLSPWRAGL